MSGLFQFIAAVFGKGAGGYATLLVFSLATITGSMYVLSTQQANEVILATTRFNNSTIAIENQADFKPETQVRTVIVNFEGGVATGLREAVTNLAGAIRAVSSNIINEAQREDAARAAAQAARPSAFGLSADSQVVSQAPALAAGAIGGVTGSAPPVVPTIPAAAPTAQPAAPPSAPPPAATSVPPTSVPLAAIPPTQPPAQSTAVAATPVPPTATPLPVPTVTPAPTQPPVVQPEQPTSAPSQPTSAPSQPTSAPSQATTPPIVATVVSVVSTAVPTAIPVATLVPTRVAAVATFAPASLNLSVTNNFQPFFSFSGNLPGGQPITRDLSLTNEGGFDFDVYLSSSGGTGPLWTDSTSGLQARITLDGVERYNGPISFNQRFIGSVPRAGLVTKVMNVTISLPEGVPNAYQATTTSVVFTFTLVQTSF